MFARIGQTIVKSRAFEVRITVWMPRRTQGIIQFEVRPSAHAPRIGVCGDIAGEMATDAMGLIISSNFPPSDISRSDKKYEIIPPFALSYSRFTR